jgi:2-phospho-L-lactate guanylyltransferase
MWAVVPVKDLDGAKQRLAAALSPVERRGLFRAMLEDVLAALASARGLQGVALLTRDAEAMQLAAAFGARVIEESENRGHTAAIAHAAERLGAAGAAGMLAMPGDVPLATADEIEAALAAHRPGPAMTIVPAHDDFGSNCVICSPPQAVPLRFGDDSFRPHLAAALRLGIEPSVVRLPGLALDIDTPADLAALLARPSATRAHAYLHQSGVAARLSRTEVAA